MMELVELDRLRGAYVGELGANGLSLEQRKRLTIAVELVANPSIVFMASSSSSSSSCTRTMPRCIAWAPVLVLAGLSVLSHAVSVCRLAHAKPSLY
jgi:hypothetical protein